jgi:hypothetical protein
MFKLGSTSTYLSCLLAALLTRSPGFPAVQAVPPPPLLKVSVLEGDGAINNIRERRAKEPVVRVEDADGKPVQGATVTFLLPALGASALFPNRETTMIVQTDADGRAAGRGMLPNNVAGEFRIRVTASLHGQSATASIRQINAAPAQAKRGSSKVIVIVVLVAAAGAGAVLGLSRGGGSSSSAAASPPAASTGGSTITPGTPSIGAPH